MDRKRVRGLERLAAVNARAERGRLRRLTVKEAYERFKELCAAIHEAFEHRADEDPGNPPLRRTHPVGLIKYCKVR